MKKSGIQSVGNKSKVLPAILWLLFLAFHAIVIFAGPKQSSEYSIFARNWGFDLISYYSLPWIILFYILCILFCIPAVNRWFMESLNRVLSAKVFQIIGSKKFLKLFVFVIVGFASVGIFWFFRIKYNFLGDMNIRVEQTLKQEFVDTEALTMWLLYQVYKLLHSTMGLTGVQTFQWVSYLAGGMFIFIALLLSDELVEGVTNKLLFFLFVICFGTIQMFFGYVEVYCLPVVSVVLYLYVSVLFIKQKVSVFIPIVAFIVAVGLHMLSIALLPSLCILLFYNRLNPWMEKRKIIILHFIVLLLVGIPFLYIIAPNIGIKYFLVPLYNSAEDKNLMALFSLEHIWEFVNSQMLAAGAGLLLFLCVIHASIIKKILYDKTLWFFATGSLGLFYTSFLTNAVRGSGDWDILGFPSILYTLFGAYMILSSGWLTEKSYGGQYILLMFLVFNILSSAAWVGINASDRSIKKIERMIIGDPGNYYQLKLPNELALAFTYGGNGLPELQKEFIKKAFYAHPDNYITHLHYAATLLEGDNPENGITILKNIIQVYRMHPAAYDVLMNYYDRKADTLNLFLITDKAFNAYRENSDAFKSKFGIERLKGYFVFLRNFEDKQGNTRRVQLINQILSQL